MTVKLPWDTQKAIGATAALVTVALTAVAFWLSYEHLHDLAGHHQLHGSRAWAWPATVDLFIAIGELLVLRASLAGRTDPFAITLTGVGSVGSIALNVSAAGQRAGILDYVIAAIPPMAALLAFGALMRQLHEALSSRRQGRDVVNLRPGPVPAVELELPKEAVSAALRPRQHVVTVPVIPEPAEAEQSPQRARSEEVVRALYDSLGNKRPGTRHIVDALRDSGLPCSDGTARETRKRVEMREPELRELPPAPTS